LAAIQLGGVTLSLWERRFFPDLGAAIHEKGATAQIALNGAIFAVTKGHSNVGLKGGQKTVSPMGKACFGVRK
jgi:hypothetical protein